jgi:transcriptional antiterminator RfaH
MAAACFDSMNWYAIHTKPRQEGLAQVSLQREAVETFFPKLRRRRTIRRVRRWVTGPLFPCYIFARFDAEKSRRLVRYANGVTNIVSFGNKPAVVDEAIVSAILEHAREDVVTVKPPTLKAGDMVEIQDGPLRGLHGIFEREMGDSERVVVLLETIASAARVQLARDQVIKL